MNIKDVITNENVDFTEIDDSYFLLGLLSAFDNRFQSIADQLIEQVSWKQFFALICINLCKESPTIKELASIMGSSHQNVKQILLKLEKKGFIQFISDTNDKRKQRIVFTEKCLQFCKDNDQKSQAMMNTMFNHISKQQIKTTIQTIIQMDENLKEIR